MSKVTEAILAREVGYKLLPFRFIRLDDASEKFHERGLPSAVFPHQRMDFPRAQIERHAVERAKPGEGLADLSSVEEEVGHVSGLAKRVDGTISSRNSRLEASLRTSQHETGKVSAK